MTDPSEVLKRRYEKVARKHTACHEECDAPTKICDGCNDGWPCPTLRAWRAIEKTRKALTDMDGYLWANKALAAMAREITGGEKQ